MLRALTHRLWRDRRRYLLCALLLFLTGSITFAGNPGTILGLPLPLVAGLAFVIGILPFAPVLSLLLPSWRFSCEMTAAGLFVLALIGWLNPAFHLLEMKGGGVYWFGVALMLAAPLYVGRITDRWLVRRGYAYVARASSHLPAEVLWDGLVGTVPHADRLACGPKTEALLLEPLAEGSTDRRLVMRWDGFSTVEEHQFITCWQPPQWAECRWSNASAGPREPATEGTSAIWITDHGTWREVEKRISFNSFPWRGVVLHWIDDQGGRTLDDQIAQLELRARGHTGSMSPSARVA